MKGSPERTGSREVYPVLGQKTTGHVQCVQDYLLQMLSQISPEAESLSKDLTGNPAELILFLKDEAAGV